ncbi:MAG: prepilin-type N-terminal cleavage/methylation domain-containing protein [Thermodesulfobacteriota bacterium]|nr:MAG: prepilin-type N-terminal cleavage/methylation domain-containing protein [Thermodesulfobacteriota bacterium]
MNLKEKGFTLVELMIAVVVLAIGILGLIGLQVAAMNGNLSANKMTTAMTLAQDEIEQLKRLPLTNGALTDAGNNDKLTSPANAASFEHTDANNPINESGENTGLGGYYRFWNVADDTPTQGAKTVVVFVFWGAMDANGLPRHRVMVPTIIGG